MLEWLAAQDIEKIGNTLIFVLTGFAVLFGLKKPAAKDEEKSKAASIEVASDFFDAEAIANLTREVTGHTIALTAFAGVLNRHGEALLSVDRSIVSAVKMAEQYRQDFDDAEDRRQELKLIQAELENERLKARLDELSRRAKLDPMARD